LGGAVFIGEEDAVIMRVSEEGVGYFRRELETLVVEERLEVDAGDVHSAEELGNARSLWCCGFALFKRVR